MRKRKLTEEEKLQRLSPRKKLALVNAWCKAKYGATSRWKYSVRFYGEKRAWVCCLKCVSSVDIKVYCNGDKTREKMFCKSKTKAVNHLFEVKQRDDMFPFPSLTEMMLLAEVVGEVK